MDLLQPHYAGGLQYIKQHNRRLTLEPSGVYPYLSYLQSAGPWGGTILLLGLLHELPVRKQFAERDHVPMIHWSRVSPLVKLRLQPFQVHRASWQKPIVKSHKIYHFVFVQCQHIWWWQIESLKHSDLICATIENSHQKRNDAKITERMLSARISSPLQISWIDLAPARVNGCCLGNMTTTDMQWAAVTISITA